MGYLDTMRRLGAEAWREAENDPTVNAPMFVTILLYINAVIDAFGQITSDAEAGSVLALDRGLSATFDAVRALRDANNRVAWWIWTYMIVPVWHGLDIKINTLNTQTAQKIADTRAFAYTLYLDAVRIATTLVRDETQARVKDVLAARGYAAALTAALHQAIEKEAAAGYSAGKGERTGPLSALVADLHARGLIDTIVNDLLIKAITVLVDTENPLLAKVVSRILGEIITKSGIGSDLGNYLYGLIVPGQGGPDPKDLPGVISDVSHRLSALEDWVTGFMLDGGPEIKSAGRQWKSVSSLLVDAGLLAFVTEAVAQPQAWATGVSDTIGLAANDALGGILDLIRKA